MYKTFIPLLLSYLCGTLLHVVHASKTLRVEGVSLRTRPLPGQPALEGADIDSLVLNCIIVDEEVDDVPFQLRFVTEDLARLGRTPLALMYSNPLDPAQREQILVFRQQPLPIAIPNPNPDPTSSSANDFFNYLQGEGYNLEQSAKDQLVLDRPLVLNIGYIKGGPDYNVEIVIRPEDLDSVHIFFITKPDFALEFPMEQIDYPDRSG